MSSSYIYILKDEKEEIMGASAKNVYLNFKSIPSKHIFIDVFHEQMQWDKLLEGLRKNDILYILSIKNMAEDSAALKQKMTDCLHAEVIIKDLDENIISPDLIITTIDFVTEYDRKATYKKQMAGIKEALEGKKQGIREYGRPKLQLPNDFEENIKKIMGKQMTHEEYRMKIGLKKSTYFAKVKKVKDAWE